MKIEVEKLVEHEDGSATATLNMDEEARSHLINVGFIEVLKISIREFDKEFEKSENTESDIA